MPVAPVCMTGVLRPLERTRGAVPDSLAWLSVRRNDRWARRRCCPLQTRNPFGSRRRSSEAAAVWPGRRIGRRIHQHSPLSVFSALRQSGLRVSHPYPRPVSLV